RCRRTELAVCSHEYRRATSDCLSADSTDDGSGDIWIANPDSVALARHAVDVDADIDIVTITPTQVITGVLTYGDVGVPSSDAGKRPATYCRVPAATDVLEKRASPIRGIGAAEHVIMERA